MTYWGLCDAGAWLGAPAGLLRGDGSPKPAYDALRGLVKGTWWLEPTPVRTDADGRFVLDGYRGDYRVTTADGRASTVTAFSRTRAPELRISGSKSLADSLERCARKLSSFAASIFCRFWRYGAPAALTHAATSVAGAFGATSARAAAMSAAVP